MEGSNNFQNCMGLKMEVRNSGFLMGNVVDMFKFHAFWPSWVPWLGDREVFLHMECSRCINNLWRSINFYSSKIIF